jgi:small subunit ribosomal protein S3
VNRDWNSTWYAEKRDYGDKAFQDLKIRKFIRDKVSHAGVKSIKIERSLTELKVVVVVLRPGVVIGRGGSGHERLMAELEKFAGTKVDLSVESFKEKDLSAVLVALEVVGQIKKRFPVRRATRASAERVMSAGAKGVKIQVSGVIGGPSSIARVEKYTLGSVPLQTLRAKIDYASETAFTGYGTLGVKVWINLPDEK